MTVKFKSKNMYLRIFMESSYSHFCTIIEIGNRKSCGDIAILVGVPSLIN